MAAARERFVLKDKLTRSELIAASVVVAECCVLIFLLPIFFVLADPLSRLVDYEFDHSPSLRPLFLQEQYQYLVSRGVDRAEVAPLFCVFALLVWILVPIFVARLASGALLFGVIDWRKIMNVQRASFLSLIVGLAFMACGIWASADINGISSTPLIAVMMHSPRAYIFFEAFVFVMSSILFVEGVLSLVDVAVTAARARMS